LLFPTKLKTVLGELEVESIHIKVTEWNQVIQTPGIVGLDNKVTGVYGK
jgi:hypothetical protein